MSGFGGFRYSSQKIVRPYYHPFGTTGDALADAVSFAPCAADAIDPSKSWGDVARCVWSKIKPIIEARSDVEAVLETVTNSDCGSVLGMIGIPSEIASVITVFAGSFWTRVQNLAADELLIIYRRRGRERSPADGGGHTLVDGAGVTVAVECPGVIDDDGNAVLMEPGAACPAAGRTSSSGSPILVARRPGGTMVPSKLRKKEEPEDKKQKAKSVSTVVVVGGVGAAAVLAYLLLA